MARDVSMVIFDGDCGICTATRDWVIARDTAGRLDSIPFQVANLGTLSPGLTSEMTSRMAFLVLPDGTRFGGARAIFEILKRLPGFWGIVGRLGANPVIAFLVEPFYRLVARNRHRVSAWLGLTACAVPQRPDNFASPHS